MKKNNRTFALSLLTVMLSSAFVVPQVAADDSFIEAIKSGKVSFSARARYESVEQDNALEDADAFTLRTTLGYETGRFNGFGGFLELEDVTALGGENYNSTTNGETLYSVVADPEGTEVNQAYLSYQGFDSMLKFGRQQITYRDAPFHRFIGNVLWRQNHQTFDAFSIQNTSLPDTQLSYAYINKVNTIFGEDANS
ncbi:MAG: alginate export family protein, partial [Methylophaga sp.]